MKGSGSLGCGRAARLLPSLHLRVWQPDCASYVQLRRVQCLHGPASLRNEAVRPSCDAVGLAPRACGPVQASAACGSLERPSAAQQLPLRLAPGEVHVWWLFPEDVRRPQLSGLAGLITCLVDTAVLYCHTGH